LQDGLPGVIELKNTHNHSLKTAAALMHLPPTAERRQQFEEYFANGMGVSEAMKYHTSVLELRSDVNEAILADGSINPKHSAVRWWYDEWRRCNLGPRTGVAALEVRAFLCTLQIHYPSILAKLIMSFSDLIENLFTLLITSSPLTISPLPMSIPLNFLGYSSTNT